MNKDINELEFSIYSIPEFFYGLIFYPKFIIKALLKEKENFYLGISILVLFISIIFSIIGKAVILKNKNIIDIFFGVGAIPYIGNWLGNIFFLISLWYFFIFFVSYKKEIRKIKQKNYPLLFFKLISLSYFPYVFLPAISILSLILSYNSLTVYIIFFLIIKFWIIYLQILIIKELFNLTYFTSILLYLIPIVIYYAFILFKLMNIFLNFFVKFL